MGRRIETLVARDLSPIEGIEPGSEWDHWLEALQKNLSVEESLISLEASFQDEGEWVVSRNEWGKWATGRYVGEITYRGRRLEIRPRFEGDFNQWLEGAFNVAIIPDTSHHQFDGSFMALLLATIWSRALDASCRHGLPALRRDEPHVGDFVRGRLDVRGTVQLRGRGSSHASSVMRNRDLNNDISRTLVCAERVLNGHIGGSYWQPPSVRDSMAQVRAAVGPRPVLPSKNDLSRIRYTPITRPFRSVAELSWRIARQEGLSSSLDSGDADGVLLDAAELWELFLVSCLRESLPGCRVEHGTTSDQQFFLLASETSNKAGIGRLKPDILVFDLIDGGLVCVIDAKYKHLRNSKRRVAGVDRGDLYQLTSYMDRFDPHGSSAGFLMYPFDPDLVELSSAETGNPWRLESGSEVSFVRIPTSIETAVPAITRLLSSNDQAWTTDLETA